MKKILPIALPALLIATTVCAQQTPQSANHPVAVTSSPGIHEGTATPRIPFGNNPQVVYVENARMSIIADASNGGGHEVTYVEGAAVKCPAQLVVSAQAAIGVAGPAIFESYLLAPDGSKQTWIKGINVTATPPLPYHVPTHGEYPLASASYEGNLVLVMNVTRNGNVIHLEVPKHFSVLCQGFKP